MIAVISTCIDAWQNSSTYYQIRELPKDDYTGVYERYGKRETSENWVLLHNRPVFIQINKDRDKCIWWQPRHWVLGTLHSVKN